MVVVMVTNLAAGEHIRKCRKYVENVDSEIAK